MAAAQRWWREWGGGTLQPHSFLGEIQPLEMEEHFGEVSRKSEQKV